MTGGLLMQINSSSFPSIEQITNQYLNNNSKIDETENQISFADIFNEKKEQLSGNSNSIEGQIDSLRSNNNVVKFSKHAGERLTDRNISLTDEQLQRLNQGVMKAESKGIKESLVLLDDYAFIVNTKNNIVVTAMDQSMEEENVYTNIDGAVVI